MTTSHITCQCTGNRRVVVEAHVFGEWAAHPGIDGDDLELRLDWWVITHVPSERAIIRSVGQLTEVEAIDLASVMGERVPRGIVPPMPTDGRLDADLPIDVKRVIRSVIYDVRGEIGRDPRRCRAGRRAALAAGVEDEVSDRTGHDISPDVDAAVREVDRASDALKSALATLSHVWHRPGITLWERRVMAAARERARRAGA